MKIQLLFLVTCLFLVPIGCKQQKSSTLQKEVQTFLDAYNKEYQRLIITANEADWLVNTKIIKGDTTASFQSQVANEALTNFQGKKENIDLPKKWLAQKDQLTPIQAKQLEYIMYWAASSPESAKDLVSALIKSRNAQVEKLYGHDFILNKKKVSTNELDDILKKSQDIKSRLNAWLCAKEVGKDLKTGLEELRGLRNKTVQAAGFKDFFNYQVSEYGMTTDEMMAYCKDMVTTVWPLYRELHTWARYTLADKYHQPVPDLLPAHWLPNRWGQDWSAMVDVKGLDVDVALKAKNAEWIVSQGEAFYQSMGFPPLPKSFYEKSSLYPLPKDATWSKNNHASAWHLDYDQDVRSLMSVEANTEWWGTTLHELGHIYYYLTYSRPEVPIILRQGANRAYHEAFGSMIGLAAMQPPFLEGRGLIPANVKLDTIQKLLQESLDFIVHIPWGAGTMTHFEHDLYSNALPKEQFNQRWWQYVKQFQGIEPPMARTEEYCDAATKTHIIDDAAQYYDYSISNLLLFQVHDHIAKNILKQDVHYTNYWGNKAAGDFLKLIMKEGATRDWRELFKEHMGSDLSAKPMMDYFSPLMQYLKSVNQGRKYTLPEAPEFQ